MSCHICHAEAVTRCFSCGGLVCAEHGQGELCPRCSGTFTAGDPRRHHFSVTPFAADRRHGWWRPQEAEAYRPPACYECQGLARSVCHHCRSHYCADHAGPRGLCRACGRSANLGLYVMAGMAALLGLAYGCLWLAR